MPHNPKAADANITSPVDTAVLTEPASHRRHEIGSPKTSTLPNDGEASYNSAPQKHSLLVSDGFDRHDAADISECRPTARITNLDSRHHDDDYSLPIEAIVIAIILVASYINAAFAFMA